MRITPLIIGVAASMLLGCGNSRRIDINETSAIGTLRSLTTAQMQFLIQKAVDQDGDGKGEFGYLSEMAGTMPTRSGQSFAAKPFIAQILGEQMKLGGFGEKSGYYFVVYLPTAKGPAKPEAGTGKPGAPVKADADLQEKRWSAYAWPVERGVSGTQAFFTNHMSDIYTTDNTVQRYSGTAKVPRPGAALSSGAKEGTNLKGVIAIAGSTDPHSKGGDWIQPEIPANDGGLWFPAGG